MCLLIATVLWFLNALSKDYSTTIAYPVKYIDAPKNQFLAKLAYTALQTQLLAFYPCTGPAAQCSGPPKYQAALSGTQPAYQKISWRGSRLFVFSAASALRASTAEKTNNLEPLQEIFWKDRSA